jgi:tetratricopeptide (TPR) repeat protein
MLDEALEMAGDDHTAGAGIVVGCPYAWCLMAKAVIRREQGKLDEGEKLSETALRIAAEHGDPETESWTRGNLATLLAYRGDLNGALALAQRNYELTERLGDVFSRHWALLYLGFVHLERGEYGQSLDYLQRADTLYREAMGSGGEAEAWRSALISDALLEVGRIDEAREQAEHAVEIARGRGLLWGMPRSLIAKARAMSAAGEPGVDAVLDEAEAVAERNGHTHEIDRIREARERVGAGAG